MRRYREDAGNDELATALYVWNVRLSAAFMEVLHHVEVLLRNSVHETMSASAHAYWYEDPDLLSPESLTRVAGAIDRIKKGGKTATPGQVVAHVHFGFWAALFDRHYESLWRDHLHKGFKDHGPQLRKVVARRMSRIRLFRNRLAHHEPIYEKGITGRHGEILELAGWLDPSAKEWIRELSRVGSVMQAKPDLE